jgi:hypothetical protein
MKQNILSTEGVALVDRETLVVASTNLPKIMAFDVDVIVARLYIAFLVEVYMLETREQLCLMLRTIFKFLTFTLILIHSC